MGSKKDKYLESAQKLILKGQLDRAIKDYEQVVALDPSDIRHRQRLAELLVRVNRKEDAIVEYEAIGKYYADNAYYLKAIAVYKQLQKLDPGSIAVSLKLASLNEKQGLTGNAIAEYGRIHSYYEKNGNRTEALKILESMLAIDPENPDTRLKFAEARFAAGTTAKAYEDFFQLALLLKKRGDESAFTQLCSRIRHLFPEKAEFVLELAQAQLESGEAASAVPLLKELTNKEQDNLKAWQLLADALRVSAERKELASVLQQMVRLFPEECSAKEGLVQSALDEGDTDGAHALLQQYGPFLLEKGAFGSLERLYLGLLELLPEDPRSLQGLQTLYQASGERAKLDRLADRLGRQTRGEEMPLDADSTVPLEEPVEAGPHEAWEEIDISMPLDDGASEVIGGADDVPEFTTGESSVGWAEPEEISLELDLSEDELVDLAELCGQAGMGEQYVQDAPLATEDTAAPLELPADEPGAFPEEPSVPDDECTELQAEIFAELEAQEDASAADFDKYSLDGLFSAFKKELNEQLDNEDTETHYNLGIAYMEMGLYDDAISEFQAAAIDPGRVVDCITLQGVCFRDKGDVIRAEETLRRGIALKGLSAMELSPLKYELALLYDATERKEEALLLYHEINAVNPGFRDTADKIACLNDEAQDYYDLDLVDLEGEAE